MGPLATAVNVHFAAAYPNFKILEYRLPGSAAYLSENQLESEQEMSYVCDPYLPVDGHPELRPDQAGWGVKIDEAYLQTDKFTFIGNGNYHVSSDGSTAYYVMQQQGLSEDKTRDEYAK